MDAELRVPVQERSVRTRGDVVEAARREFSERGYAPTTAKSIAARAGVAVGTFYHYFPDKDAVLRELAAARVDALERRMTGNAPDMQLEPAEAAEQGTQVRAFGEGLAELRRRIRKDIRAYVDYHRRDRGLHSVIAERRLCDAQLAARLTEVEQRGVRRSAEALKRWGFSGDCQAAAFMIFSLLDGAVHNHVLGHPTLSDARFVEALADAIVRIGASRRVLMEIDAGK
jgi:AcrR family transcriptional regulator